MSLSTLAQSTAEVDDISVGLCESGFFVSQLPINYVDFAFYLM
jgi:hypothetical protein